MELLLNWGLRGIIAALGIGAGLWLFDWFRQNWRGAPERWTVRIAAGMLLLAGVYTIAHARLLAQRSTIEAGREAYAIFGDPRRTEMRRGEVRGWMLDCTADPANALASYRATDGQVERWYPLDEAGANFIGGGSGADERDYTIEVLFADRLRSPATLFERGELHPAGRDLPLTLCRGVTAEAHSALAATGIPGAVVVQEVETGAVLAYAATGGPLEPPLGVKQYSPPGSVFKLALAAVWWEAGLPDDTPIPCPARIQVTDRAAISNYGDAEYGTLVGPAGVLIPSCNTGAVWMAQRLREEVGSQAFIQAYRDFGFIPYAENPPTDSIGGFWRTDEGAWATRMTPAPARIRMSEATGDAEWAQLAIGQGPLDVTVMAVSRFVHAIANEGVMLAPTFEAHLAGEGPGGQRVMSGATAQRLQEAMRLVVDEGTGRSAGAAFGQRDWRLGAKTGTAQVAGRPDNGWFAAILFSPEGEPRYTIVSFLEGGGPGGARAGAVAARVARLLAGEQPAVRGGT